MPKLRNYQRLTACRDGDLTDNEIQYRGKDIFYNDVVAFSTNNNTNTYAQLLSKESWKDVAPESSDVAYGEDYEESKSDLFYILEMERSLWVAQRTDPVFRQVLVFFLILEGKYYQLSDEAKEEFKATKTVVVQQINDFQREKSQRQARVSSIRHSPLQFIMYMLGCSRYQGQRYLHQYQRIVEKLESIL